MSVFDALGAAATILQFVDYGIKFGNKVVAVYKNRSDLAELHKLTRDFQQANETFKEVLLLRSSNPNPGEILLIKIAEDCHQTATDLTNLLDGLVLKDDDKSKRSAFKVALRGEWKKKDILAKQHELELLRQKCHEQLSVIVSDQQYGLADALDRIERDQQRHYSAASQQLTRLKADVIAEVTTITASQSTDLMNKLFAAHKVATLELPQESILSSLRYSDIENRHDTIPEPGHSSYNWIFETQCASSRPVTYMSWLESGDGLYWVTGKAGSGKSTLIKHICNDDQTAMALGRWANGRKVLTASHYFWYLGSPMEKSYSGLVRSILYKILGDFPELINLVCPSRWSGALRGRDVRSMPWSDADLRDCLESLVTRDLKVEDKTPCFCFFVDGLDEYDGDKEVVNFLVRLASTGRTKICASSRPWNRFEAAFKTSKEQGKYLELHHHTRNDIARVVYGELSAAMINVDRNDSDWTSLIQEVIDRAEGVFLWVTLVLKKELLPCLESREDLEFLRARLDAVPSDLNDYFQHIFERIWADEKFRTQTARIFKCCLAASSPLPMATVQVIIHDRPDRVAISAPVEHNYQWDHPDEIEILRARVNGRCQDLLAIVDPRYNDNDQDRICRIEFLHRSVQDFLAQAESVQNRLDDHAGVILFDSNFTLFACYVFLIKRACRLADHSSFLGSTYRRQQVLQDLTKTWCTEAFLHVREVPSRPSTLSLIYALDSSMQPLRADPGHYHWSNDLVERPNPYVLPFELHDLDVIERGGRDLLGHLIELGLTSHVEDLLRCTSISMQTKKGRPYLDYALRYDASASFRRDRQAEPDCAMIELLLGQGCDVNEVVHMHGNRTLWDSYLYFIYLHPALRTNIECHRRAVWLLINHGAEQTEDRVIDVDVGEVHAAHNDVIEMSIDSTNSISMKEMMIKMFGAREAEAMQQQVSKNGRAWAWPAILSWVGSQRRVISKTTHYVWKAEHADQLPETPMNTLSTQADQGIFTSLG